MSTVLADPLVVNSATELQTALGNENADRIQLGAAIDAGNYSFTQTNALDLKGFNLGTTDVEILGAEGKTLTISDSGETKGVLTFTTIGSAANPGAVVLDGVTSSSAAVNVNSTLNLTNASGLYVGDATGGDVFQLDGGTLSASGSSNTVVGVAAGEEETQEYKWNALLKNGAALNLADSSQFYVYGDTTLSGASNISVNNAQMVVYGDLAADAGSTDTITLSNGGALSVAENLDLANITLGTNSEAATAGTLSVGKTLTLNKNLKVSASTTDIAPVSSLSAQTLLFGTEVGSATLDVADGGSAQFGIVKTAQNPEANVTINVGKGATFGAFTNESDSSWTGDMTLGAADAAVGGHTNINIAAQGTMTVAKDLNTWLRNGDAITLAGGGTGTVDSVNDGAAATIYGAANLQAASGNATLSLTKNAQIGSVGNLSLGAADGATLTINLAGVAASGTNTPDNTLASALISDADVVIGGEGDTNTNVGSNSYITGANISYNKGALNVSGNGAYLYAGKSVTDSEGATTLTGGDLTLGNGPSTTDVTVDNKGQLVAAKDILVATDKDSTTGIDLKEGTLMQADGKITLGAEGEGTLSADKASVVAKDVMTVGKDGKGIVSAKNTYVQAGGLVLAEGADSQGNFVISGNESVLNLTAQSAASVTPLGEGRFTATDMMVDGKTDSGVFIAAGSGMYLNGDATFDNSLLVFYSDSADASKKAVISTGENGTVKITKGSLLAGRPNINGNFSIDGTSSYEVTLASDGTGDSISITDGSANIANGAKLNIYFSDNGVIADQTWDIINITSDDKTNDIVTGAWDIVSPIPFYEFTQERVNDNQTLQITSKLDEEYFEDRIAEAGGNANEIEVGKALDNYYGSWYDTLLTLGYGTDEDLLKATAQLNGAARANTMMLARQSLWVPVNDRISWDSGCRAYTGPQNPYATNGERSSVWFQSGYRGMSVDGGKRSSGYDTDGFSMLIGIDTVFETYLAGGVFFGYSDAELEQDFTTAKASNYSFGAYAGYKLYGGFELKGMLAYTGSDYEMDRDLSTVGTSAHSDFRGSMLTANVELSRPIYLGALVVRPVFAVDSECVWQGEGIESDAGIYGYYYEKSDDTWTFARFGGNVEFAGNQYFNLKGKAYYAIQMDGDGTPGTEARFAGTGEVLHFLGDNPGDDYFNLGLTMSYAFGAQRRFLLIGNYDGYFADNMDVHMVNGGFQWSF